MKPVLIYTSAWCGYSMRAKELLESKNVAYEEVVCDGKPELRAELTEKTGSSSVPQIWIGDEYIGGCDDLFALERAGELDAKLSA